LKIGGTILIRWRSHRDELKKPVPDPFIDIGGEMQTTGLTIALNESIKPRFMDGYIAIIQAIDLA